MLDRHLVEENSEDTLLHLTSVFSAKDDHLLLSEIDSNTGGAGHARRISVCREGTGIVYYIVWVEVLKLRTLWADQHIAHEQGVVGAGADHPNVDPVSLVPSCISINDVDSVTSVQVIDGSLSVDFPYL